MYNILINMENEIDYKKLESCMVELFCDKNWDMYDRESRCNTRYITTRGQVITTLSKSIVHEWLDFYSKLVDEEVNKTVLDDYDVTVHKFQLANWSSHYNLLKWSMGLYITKYVLKQGDNLDINAFESDPRIREESPFCKKWAIYFNKMTKMCRVNWRGSVVIGGHDELNIETYHSLTHPQRKVILDMIEGLHLSPGTVFIDDHSKEQCVKRQLGLHFF